MSFQVAPRNNCGAVTTRKQKGARSVLVRTVDTDVVVILVAQFHTFSLTWPGTSFWVAFGMGKHFQLLSISICEYLGEQKCRALPFFFTHLLGATQRQHF